MGKVYYRLSASVLSFMCISKLAKGHTIMVISTAFQVLNTFSIDEKQKDCCALTTPNFTFQPHTNGKIKHSSQHWCS